MVHASNIRNVAAIGEHQPLKPGKESYFLNVSKEHDHDRGIAAPCARCIRALSEIEVSAKLRNTRFESRARCTISSSLSCIDRERSCRERAERAVGLALARSVRELPGYECAPSFLDLAWPLTCCSQRVRATSSDHNDCCIESK